MNEISEDLKYQKLIKRLHTMQKVNAPEGFEANVMRRINSEILYPEPKTAKWKAFLKSPGLIPSASLGFIAAVVFIISQFGTSDNKVQNFLMAKPEAIKGNNVQTYKVESIPNTFTGSTAAASLISTSGSMDKFTYKKIYLTPEDKARIKQLKERILTSFNNSK